MWKSTRWYNYNILSPCPKVLYQNNTCTLKQYMSYNAFLCSCSCWIMLSRVNRGILPVARQHTRPAQRVDVLKWGLTLLTRAFVYVRKSPPRSPLWTGLAHGCSMWLREHRLNFRPTNPPSCTLSYSNTSSAPIFSLNVDHGRKFHLLWDFKPDFMVHESNPSSVGLGYRNIVSSRTVWTI